LDGDVSVGDRFRVGTAEVLRDPAADSVLQARDQDGRNEFVTEFLERGLLGFYLWSSG
jgi:hypothetical protein